jgi:hypothetical protein
MIRPTFQPAAVADVASSSRSSHIDVRKGMLDDVAWGRRAGSSAQSAQNELPQASVSC